MAGSIMTLCPVATPVDPPSITSPTISWPMTRGYSTGIPPERIFTSVPQMPTVSTRTSASGPEARPAGSATSV